MGRAHHSDHHRLPLHRHQARDPHQHCRLPRLPSPPEHHHPPRSWCSRAHRLSPPPLRSPRSPPSLAPPPRSLVSLALLVSPVLPPSSCKSTTFLTTIRRATS